MITDETAKRMNEELDRLRGIIGAREIRQYNQMGIPSKDIPTTEQVNHPAHYNTYPIETIEMMRRIWGDEKTADWCEMTAYKYRMRMGTKDGNPIEQDLQKEKWYLTKAKEIRNEN